MSYATQADLVARFGQVEVDQLCDPDNTGTPDYSYVTQATGDADAIVNSYLVGRYADVMPFTAVPQPLPLFAADISRYLLMGKRVTEEVQKRYDDAIAWLKSVQRGEAGLGLPDPDPTEGQLVAGDEILIDGSPCRLFGRRKGY